MSKLSSEESKPETPTNLSVYCKHYKFFLVEELVLENYNELHYGMCSLIGKLRDAGNYFELENIRLPHFPSEYALPEGILTIRLLVNQYKGDRLQHGRYCEVCGEVMLLNVGQRADLHKPSTLTSHAIQLQLSQLPDKNKRENFVNEVKRNYRVALEVDYLQEVDRAADLAERNLEIRLLCK